MVHKRDEINSRLIRLLPKEAALLQLDLANLLAQSKPVTYEQPVTRALQAIDNYLHEDEHPKLLPTTKLLATDLMLQLKKAIETCLHARRQAIEAAQSLMAAVAGTVFEHDTELIMVMAELQKAIIDAQQDDYRVLTADIDFYRLKLAQLYRVSFERRGRKLKAQNAPG